MYGLIANILALLSDLLGRITPARADKLDQLDAAVSSRAPANTAVSRSVLTDVRVALLDNLANIASPPARIKSIQRGTVTVPGGSTFASSTLATTVDPNKSVLMPLGEASIGNNISNFNVGSRLQLVDGNTVRAWSAGGANAIEVGYQIVEYY